MTIEIKVPTLGESITEATIGKWLKQVGDSVAIDEPLVELETDKVSVEIPAASAGTIASIVANEGDVVQLDAVVGTIDEGGTSGATAAEPKALEPKALEPKAPAAADTPPPAEPAAEPPKQTSSKQDSGEAIELIVPVLGESITEATIGKWLKQVGDAVAIDEPLVELETDKVNVEIPAPAAGVLASIISNEGDVVQIDAVVGTMASSGDAVAAAPIAAAPTVAAQVAPAPAPSASAATPPSPASAKILAEKEIDPANISGTGKRGQILKGDVLSQLENLNLAPAQPKPIQPTEAQTRVPMTRLRQTIAKRLKEAQNMAAMLTTFNEVDMSSIMDLRKNYKETFEKKHNIKLGFMGFFTRACCQALLEFPAINAQIDGTDIVYNNQAHIGVAVGTDKGLVVPIVRAASEMSLADIEKEIARLGEAARTGKLAIEDMQGGTFTISNGGIYGSLMSTPILNAPQSGILGMHKIQTRPIAVDGKIEIRPMMYLALSYDHRIVDGKEAVMFLAKIKESLEEPTRLILEL